MKFSRFQIRPDAVIAAALLFWLAPRQLAFSVLLSAALHECGHLLAVRLFGGEVRRVSVGPEGAEIAVKGERISYIGEMAVSLAGPAASLFLALVFSVSGRLFGNAVLYQISGVNLVLFLFNMLPISVLDGGRALGMLLLQLTNVDTADTVSKILDAVFSTFLVAAGLCVMRFSGKNCSLFLCSAWIVILCCKKNRIGVRLPWTNK